MLFRHSAGTHKENELTRNSSRNSRLSLLSHCGLNLVRENGIGVRELISTSKKKIIKKAQQQTNQQQQQLQTHVSGEGIVRPSPTVLASEEKAIISNSSSKESRHTLVKRIVLEWTFFLINPRLTEILRKMAERSRQRKKLTYSSFSHWDFFHGHDAL